MKVQIEGQMSIFDMLNDQTPTEYKYPIEQFDKKFKVGDLLRYYDSKNVLEITDMRYGELMAQIRNVTLEERKMYVGERYYINKESYGKYYRREGIKK